MSRKTFEYVECNGCFRQVRLAEGSFMSPDRPPDGWVEVRSNVGAHIWDLCPDCHKEIAVVLFDNKRIDRVLQLGNNHGNNSDFAANPDSEQ